jgi:hypothetical protein
MVSLSQATTLQLAREKRAEAEAEILGILIRLQASTGLDIAGVTAHLWVDSTKGEPQRRVHAVRIDLAV